MSDRLDSIRKKIDLLKKKGTGTPPDRNASEKKASGFLTGWEKCAEYVYKKRNLTPFSLEFPDRFVSTLVPQGIRETDLLFFDTETTGLSGGAGTFIFLIGFAWFEGKSLVSEQYFLADFPGEPDFLNAIRPFFDPARLFVSYNGKGFDSHLLSSRFIMNRIPLEFGAQLDLLYLSRRFFKRIIGTCSLSDIEEKILSIGRTGDVPGFEIPGLYFRYLKSTDESIMEPVFRHNHQDVISLAHIFKLVVDLAQGKGACPSADPAAVGQYLLPYNREQGINILTEALRSGDAKSGHVLGQFHKENGDWEKAVPVWEELAASVKSVQAVIELAKYYEHRKKDFEAALKWIESVSRSPLDQDIRMDMMKRKTRILAKLKKNSGEGI
jgi:uncharacterized protein